MINDTLLIPDYSDPFAYCDIATDAIHHHYQQQVLGQFWMYFLAGIACGILLTLCWQIWRKILTKKAAFSD